MNINIIAPITTETSYGIVSVNLLSELTKLGHTVSLFPIGQIGGNDIYRFKDIIQDSLQHAVFFDKSAPCIRIWHQFQMDQFVGKGKHLGYCFFELDTLNEREIHHLNSCDGVLVASKWAKSIVHNHLPKLPVSVVPLGVDLSIFKPQINSNTDTIFLSIGKWEKRKCQDEVVEAFNSAFSHNCNVQLWLCCDNIFFTPEENEAWKTRYFGTNLGQKIKIIPRQDTHSSVARLMSRVDCVIGPSRAEGWNLEVLEAMACGKDVITTNYSGHTEYCKEGCLLIDPTEFELASDGKWFFGGGKWMKFGAEQFSQLVDYMQFIQEKKDEGRPLLNREGVRIANEYTWTNTAKKLLEAL